MQPTVFFDGDCSLCNGAVRFARSNTAGGSVIRFEPLAGGQAHPAAPDTMILIDASGTYLRSDAALRLAGYLRPPWPLVAAAGRCVPRPVREAVYRFIAANRNRLFGQDERGRSREDGA